MEAVPLKMNALAQQFQSAFEDYEASLRCKAEQFKSFLNVFNSAYSLARESRAKTTPHLDVLRIFGLGARELCHSRALAWFLRADAEHEQGTLFINALLRLVNLPPVSSDSYHVWLEKPDRVDVAAYAVREFAVFLENKVYAREQDRQFERLMNSLRTFSNAKQIPSGRRVAIFLTNDGRSALTAPAEPDPTIAVFNFRRDVLFREFSTAALAARVKSPLLENLLKAYEESLAKLT